ncbi:MAG: hypothetical protein AAGF79_06930 [Pseudomonadota bacterium]
MELSEFTILERNLTRALLTEDFELYRSLFHLPLHNVPRGGEAYDLTTDAALREDFVLYVQALKIQRVTDIYRRVLAISELDTDWVEVTVETNILGSTGRVVAPFHTQFVLRPRDGDWRITQVCSSFGHIRWTRGLADISDGQFEDLHAEGRLDAAPADQKTDGDDND